MADFDAQFAAVAPVRNLIDSIPGEVLTNTATRHFKMLGQAANNNDLDTWRVTGEADSAGAQYAGALATPLQNIAVAATWTT